MKIRVDNIESEDKEIAFVYENCGKIEEGLYFNEHNQSVDISDGDIRFIITSTDWNNFVKAVNMMDAKLKEIGYEWFKEIGYEW